MKIFIGFFAFCFSLNFSSAQTWSTLGTGVNNLFGGFVNSITDFNGDLYVGGSFNQAGGSPANNIARWNGNDWQPVDSGVTWDVQNMCVYNNELIVDGSLKWNGTAWSVLGSGCRGNAMTVFNGELYVAGHFDSVGSIPVNNIARWNGVDWDSVGSGSIGWVLALCVYNNELYAGGQFYISKWNGSTWTSVDIGSTNIWQEAITSMTVFENNLVVTGRFDSIGNVFANNVARWNGSVWSAFGSGIGDPTEQGETGWAVEAYNNELYAGGFFHDAGGTGAKHIARWDGSSWFALSSGLDSRTIVLHSFNIDLYVGGGFGVAGGLAANGIAKWNLPIGIDEITTYRPVEAFPNPVLSSVYLRNEINSNYYLGDINSKRLCEGIVSNDLFELKMTDYPTGSYILTIIRDKSVIHSILIKN